MPSWLTILLSVVGGLGAVVSAYVAARNFLRADRDRAAGYLDRIATMVAEMANELETKGASPARCKELVEAIGNLELILGRSLSVYRLRGGNELLRALTTVVDPPMRITDLSPTRVLVI